MRICSYAREVKNKEGYGYIAIKGKTFRKHFGSN